MVYKAKPEEADVIAAMAGELLSEIMRTSSPPAFHFDRSETMARARAFLTRETYIVFVATDSASEVDLGFVACRDGCALYAEGVFAVISEFYVRSNFRSCGIGH